MASMEIGSDAGALPSWSLQGTGVPASKKRMKHGRVYQTLQMETNMAKTTPTTTNMTTPMTYTNTPEWRTLEEEIRRTTTCTQYVHEQMYKARVDCDKVLAETGGGMAAVMSHIAETTAGYRREADWCDAVDGLGPQE
jgi:hypothetical protein